MSKARTATGLACLVAVLAGGTAISQYRRARTAEDRLVTAHQERTALQGQLTSAADRLQLSEARATEAEKDNHELLKAIAQKSQPAPRTTRMTVVTPDVASLPPEVQQRLAYERAYQQDLAKRRAQEAREKAQIEYEAHALAPDPVAKFNRLIEGAEMYLSKAQFQAARTIFGQAMGERPLDLPLTDRIRQLQSALREQGTPVDVICTSDGQTHVTIAGTLMFGMLTNSTTKLLPGNYEVIGRRNGYQDVVVSIQVRNGTPPPVVNVACTVPAAP